MIGNKKIAFVLSGGSAYGFAHVGFLKYMKELGIEPDIIAPSYKVDLTLIDDEMYINEFDVSLINSGEAYVGVIAGTAETGAKISGVKVTIEKLEKVKK